MKYSMKRRKSPPKARPVPVRWYADSQKTMDRMLALGVPKGKIFQGWKGQTVEKFRMREGEYLGVLDGLRGFGGKREIRAAVKRVHSFKAAILDIETGEDSCTHGVEMFDKATKPRRRSLDEYRAEREKLDDKRRKRRGMKTKAEAYIDWHNPNLTVEEKVERTGWSRAALYDAFGKTGAPAGRPPKKI